MSSNLIRALDLPTSFKCHLNSGLNCNNCRIQNFELTKLQEEVNILNNELDKLREEVFLLSTETHITQELTNDLCCNIYSTDTETDYATIQTCDMFDTTDTSQNSDTILNLFCVDSNNQQIIEPALLHPGHPFSNYDLHSLDKTISYTEIFSNRSVEYYGEYPYSYNNTTHDPKPIASNKYLCNIINQLKIVMPNYCFNSVMITKFNDGSQYIGYHSDYEDSISSDSDIVTISLGESRILKFKAKHDNSQPEVSNKLVHGDLYSMSKKSQNYFKHSIPIDFSTNPRISITFRQILPPSSTELEISTNEMAVTRRTNNPIPSVQNRRDLYQPPTTDGYQPSNQAPFQKVSSVLSDIDSIPEKVVTTLYISSSMFRELDPNKLSTKQQTAEVLYYPGATAEGILSRLQVDNKFRSINPCHVKNVYLLCGTNDVDRILEIPRQQQQNMVDIRYKMNTYYCNKTKGDILNLSQFLHEWAALAKINIINILPRESWVRNTAINELNKYIFDLSGRYSYINMVRTEFDSRLFSFRDGYRKKTYFKSTGLDNVHLNQLGVIRLGKYLKYLVHKT